VLIYIFHIFENKIQNTHKKRRKRRKKGEKGEKDTAVINN